MSDQDLQRISTMSRHDYDSYRDVGLITYPPINQVVRCWVRQPKKRFRKLFDLSMDDPLMAQIVHLMRTGVNVAVTLTKEDGVQCKYEIVDV